jgi:hypothetical protein
MSAKCEHVSPLRVLLPFCWHLSKTIAYRRLAVRPDLQSTLDTGEELNARDYFYQLTPTTPTHNLHISTRSPHVHLHTPCDQSVAGRKPSAAAPMGKSGTHDV